MFLWIKALHVVAIISWMAGLLYLPRLFVYHTQVEVGSEQSSLFKVMEYRLFRFIMIPAMIVAWISGLTLAFLAAYWSDPWFLAKFVLVLALTGSHIHQGRLVAFFAADANRHPTRFYRILNEVPTLLMVGIVILVIVKPF
jgi:putative membrane protein